MARKRVAILISGTGSNMAALIDAAKSDDYPAEVVGVISNKPDVPGLTRAAEEGLPTAVFRLKDYPDKQAADEAIDRQLVEWGVDLICLAGFMRLLSPEFCEKWLGRALNIHPSLLPDFPGLDTHKRALDAGVSEHGCSAHFITSGMDEGPVIGQVAVPVELGDTPSLLADRVLKAEHKLYPWALAQVAAGKITFDGIRRSAGLHHIR